MIMFTTNHDHDLADNLDPQTDLNLPIEPVVVEPPTTIQLRPEDLEVSALIRATINSIEHHMKISNPLHDKILAGRDHVGTARGCEGRGHHGRGVERGVVGEQTKLEEHGAGGKHLTELCESVL